MGRPIVTSVPLFSTRSSRAQVRVLRGVAFRALSQWRIQPAGLRLAYHGYNTTFRVADGDGRLYALRLAVNHRKPAEHTRAEMAWLTALSADTDLLVPTPIATADGRLAADVTVPGLEGAVSATLFGWLPGTLLERCAEPSHLIAAGRAMAVMHDHARHWAMPTDASLPAASEPWQPDQPFLDVIHPLLDDDRRSVFEAAVVPVRAAHAEVDGSGIAQALHADLHLANMKWHRGRLSVLDFDDAVWGVPAHDLAISIYYLRPRQALVDALLEGYASRAEAPPLSPQSLEALLAARNLLLVDDCCGRRAPTSWPCCRSTSRTRRSSSGTSSPLVSSVTTCPA